MTTPAQERLLERALALPQAVEADFFGGRRAPEGVDAAHLRIIDDTALRTRFIEAGLAEGLQSPKGPQRIKSIIRIYPNFDSPARGSTIKRPPATRRKPIAPANALPTVEELESLLSRIRQAETDVAREMRPAIDGEIDRLKRTIVMQTGDELERTHRRLGDALERRRHLAAQIRAEAIRRVDADADFPARAFLALISH